MKLFFVAAFSFLLACSARAQLAPEVLFLDTFARRALMPGEPTLAELDQARAFLEEWENQAPSKAPRVLRICYWTPADRDPSPAYRERLTRVMKHIQDFYRQEMATWGFPGRSIQLEEAEEGLLRIHPVQGQLKSDECSETDPKCGQAIRRDCLRALRDAGIEGEKETIVIFCNLADWDPSGRTMGHHSPYYASGDSQSGTAWQVDSPLLDAANLGIKDQHIQDRQYGRISLGKYNSIFIGGVCHELGHALGLPHCKESAASRSVRGTALMGQGNRTYGDELRGEGRGSFLTLPHALKLAGHPQFSGSMKQMTSRIQADFSNWIFEPGPDGLKVRGHVRGNLPVYAILAYQDPDGSSDYDSEIAAGIVEKSGNFSIHLPIPEKKDCWASLRFVAVGVNGTATAGHWAGNAFNLRCRISSDGISDVSLAREKIELRAQGRNFLTGSLSDTEFQKLLPRVQSALLRLKLPNHAKGKPTPSEVPVETKDIPLSDMAPSNARTGWGGIHFDRNNEGQPLQGPQGLFTHGLYAHADSVYEYQLDGKWERLIGFACLLEGGAGQVEATIEAEGKTVWGPRSLREGDQASFSVDLKGVQKISLRFAEKNGINGAWSAWGEPRLQRLSAGAGE